MSKAKKDKRARCSANRRKRSTFVGCGSCSGKKLNPYYVLQGVKRLNDICLEKDGRLKGASEGSAYSISESGYMNDKIWEDEHAPYLVKETRSLIQETKRETKWQLLLLDGFLSHTMTFKALKMLFDNRALVVCFPSHASADFQPLDVTAFAVFKLRLAKLHRQESLSRFQDSADASTQQWELPALMNKVWSENVKETLFIKGFEKTGLWSFNPPAFDDPVFAPSIVFFKTELASSLSPSLSSSSSSSSSSCLSSSSLYTDY